MAGRHIRFGVTISAFLFVGALMLALALDGRQGSGSLLYQSLEPGTPRILQVSDVAGSQPRVSSSAATASGFDFAAWEARYGRKFDIAQWLENNPHPFAKRFNPKVSYMLPRYFINLGPIGVRTWMHDQNWAHRYTQALEKFPKALVDEHGPLQNAFEIIHVQKSGPAHGHLREGDFILEIEGEPIKSAQWLDLDQTITTKKNRGIEMHAGQLIDRAEGRGAIRLKVLRLPEEGFTSVVNPRTWGKQHEVQLDKDASGEFSIPLGNSNTLKVTGDTFGKGHGPVFFDDAHIINKQGQKISLWDLERVKFKNAWGRVHLDKKTGHRKALAPFEFDFGLPPGDWRFEGKAVAGSKPVELVMSTLERATLHDDVLKHVVTVEFEIPKIGSFGESFDPEGEKARNYSAILAKRLAVQQLPDGSWLAEGGYTTPAFYTSTCGLGLLATGDPAYDEHVKRAAHYVAYSGNFSSWSYTRGWNALFLGEYYLRTKDESILPGLSLALQRAEDNLLVGYIAGHHASPGYGGSGYIGGSGPIACAFAVAEHTPAEFARGTAAKMLERIQALAIRGTTPYGRDSGRSVQKKVFDLNLRWPGQGGSAGTAPFYMAARINGGSKFFTEIVSRRWMNGPYGDADYGHGTHTLPFILGSTAISLSSDKAHRDNMSAFLWKLTTHRGFDGLIVNNANPLEFHSGEGVMGKPWWSTGGYLLLLNAHKRNLAMTGHPDYMAEEQTDLPLIHDADLKVFRQTLRQWRTVEAALGDRTPKALKDAIVELAAIPRDSELGHNVFAFMDRHAAKNAIEVSRIRMKDRQLKNYCVEILLGVNHDVYLDHAHWDLSESDKKKRAEQAKKDGKEDAYRKEASSVELTIHSHTFFTTCNGVLPNTVKSDNPLPKLISQGTVRITDKRGKRVKGLPARITLSNDQLEQTFTIPDADEIDTLRAHFKYKCGGVEISYVRELQVNRIKDKNSHASNLRKLWVPGELVRSYNGWSVHFRLPAGGIYHGSANGQKPKIYDAKGVPQDEHILRWGNKSANFPMISTLAEGHDGRFLVSFGSKYEGWVHEFRMDDPKETRVHTNRLSVLDGALKGDGTNAYDGDPNSYVTVVTNDQGKATLMIDAKDMSSPTSLYYLAAISRGLKFTYTVECQTADGWQAIGWGVFQRLQDFQPFLSGPKSKKYRIALNGKPNTAFKLYEVQLFDHGSVNNN